MSYQFQTGYWHGSTKRPDKEFHYLNWIRPPLTLELCYCKHVLPQNVLPQSQSMSSYQHIVWRMLSSFLCLSFAWQCVGLATITPQTAVVSGCLLFVQHHHCYYSPISYVMALSEMYILCVLNIHPSVKKLITWTSPSGNNLISYLMALWMTSPSNGFAKNSVDGSMENIWKRVSSEALVLK